MTRHALLLGAGLIAGACLGLPASLGAAPAMSRSAAVAGSSATALPIEKTQVRRRVVGGRVAPYGGGYYRGYGRRGISPGAAVGIGVGAAALGILGAAAAANAAPYPYTYDPYYYGPTPVYGGCYIARQPMYDEWGNYLGRRRVQVCD